MLEPPALRQGAFRDWVTREIHNAGDPDYEGRIRTVIRL